VSVACNGAHSLKERLARWLLMMRDRRTTTRWRLRKASSPKCWVFRGRLSPMQLGIGTRRFDCAWPTAGYDTRSAGPHESILRMLSTGPGASRCSSSNVICLKIGETRHIGNLAYRQQPPHRCIIGRARESRSAHGWFGLLQCPCRFVSFCGC
jgi:hypothetical protein